MFQEGVLWNVLLSYGKCGGDKVSCPKHREEHPDGPLVNLSDLTLCVYVGCLSKGCVAIRDSPMYHFCKYHVDGLEARGLPREFVIRTENTKKCQYPGCTICSSYDGGKFCLQHSNTKISDDTRQCPMACCKNGGPRPFIWHPDYLDSDSEFFQKKVCSFARRVLIEDSLLNNDKTRTDDLLEHFKLNKVLTLNSQSAFRFACEKEYYRELLDCTDVKFDDGFHEGRKMIGSKRPDIFYKWIIDGLSFGIHIEYDEDSTHEDDDERLRIIEKDAGCEGNTYVIRVRGGHDTKDPVCKRVRTSENLEYYKVTESGKEVSRLLADKVVERIDWIRQGLSPNEGRPGKIYV